MWLAIVDFRTDQHITQKNYQIELELEYLIPEVQNYKFYP